MATEPASRATKESAAAKLWRNHDFRMLMVGYTASQFGYQVTTIAAPLVAVLTLDATSFQVGLLRTAGQIPYPLFVLFVGVVVDRWRRRNMLVAADLIRGIVLMAIPAAFLLHSLSIPLILVVAFLVGIGTVIFDVGSLAYLPRLVDRKQLAEGNSQLQSLSSIATVGGPAVGGLLVSLFLAPRALIAAVALWVISVATIWRIRKVEPKVNPVGDRVRPMQQIKEGIKFVVRNPVLRPAALITTAFNFSYAAYLAISIIYFPRELGLSGFEIGLVLAAVGPGILVGAILSSRLPKRFGYGKVLLPCAFISDFFLLGIALVHGNSIFSVGLLVLFNFIYGCLSGTFAIALVAIRQAATPDRLLGRVMATLRFLGVGPVPLGSLCGGLLAGTLGIRPALVAVALVMCTIPVPFFTFPTMLSRIGKDLPVAAES